MKFSVMVSSGLLVLVGAVMLVEASYGSGSSNYNAAPAYSSGSGSGSHGSSGSGYGSGMSQYGAGGCSGYNCASGSHSGYGMAQAKKSYSTHVRPVVYGGRGMYSYKGYARHSAAPKGHSRYARSCNGYNCGASGYKKQSSYSAAPQYQSMRPVHALVLTPMQPSYGAPQKPAYAGYGAAMKSYGGYGRVARYSDAPARSYGAY